MKALKIFFIALAAASAPMTAAFADEPRIFVASTSQYAVSSYDPVADFTVGAPTRGSDQWVATYQGARYRFPSQPRRLRRQPRPLRAAIRRLLRLGREPRLCRPLAAGKLAHRQWPALSQPR
jgi:hypothetical protein